MDNNEQNPGAVVIDGHGRADLGVVRALGEHGVPVYLLTDDRLSPVAHSRYVTQVLRFPPPSAPESERVAALVEIGQQFRHQPVFFSTGDSSLTLFSRNRALLESYFRHHIGDADLIEALYDKAGFAALAEERGLDVPASVVPRTMDDLEAALPRLRFPVIVKPAEKCRWHPHREIHALAEGNLKGIRVDSPARLRAVWRVVSRYDSQAVVQNYIEGRDEEIWSLHAFIDRGGSVIGAFTGQKLRTYPIHRGIGCFQASRYRKSVAEAGLSALRALGYTGHAVVQVKRVPGEDRYTIFEINCRYSSWNYLHARAGVNMPLAAYRASLGEKQAPLPQQREEVRWIDVCNDLLAFRDYRRIGEWRWRDWLRSYRGENCYAFFDGRDPLPALLPPTKGLLQLTAYPLRWLRRRTGMTPVTAARS